MAQSYSKKPNYTNFFEAFKELGRETISEAKVQIRQIASVDVPQSLGLGGSGTLNPNEAVSMDQLKNAEHRGEQKAQAEFDRRLHQMRQEERSFLEQKESQTKQQIASIQQEIKSLAKSVKEFNQEVEIAATRAIVNPGIYHKNFFEHLRIFIVTIRQRVDSSKHWLATTNHRSKKQGYYWNQVSRSGTKFMMSSERYMVTSTG